MEEIYNQLHKALEAGGQNAAPATLNQGGALQIENLATEMEVVTYENKHLKIQKDLTVKGEKNTLVQFVRQLSYGNFGGSAQLEGNVGDEETGDYQRAVIPMCYYVHVRRVTTASKLVDTFDGRKSDEREANNGALKIAGDIEFDLFRGCADFSNGGLFDGNPSSLPGKIANMQGLNYQVRLSDSDSISHDLMFSEYGSDQSVVIAGGGTLTQGMIDDARARAQMNHSEADVLYVDPLVLNAYNKITYQPTRFLMGGAVHDSIGTELRQQNTAFGVVKHDFSRFLSGKTSPARPRSRGPAAPAGLAAASAANGTTPFLNGQIYRYGATAVNEVGESPFSALASVTIGADGHQVNVTITHPASGTFRWFNVYRSEAGAAAQLRLCKFIGRIKVTAGAGTTVFVDLGQKLPGFVDAYLVQKDTFDVAELAPYSRTKLAQVDLTEPEAHFRFLTLRVKQPRKNALIDNLDGNP